MPLLAFRNSCAPQAGFRHRGALHYPWGRGDLAELFLRLKKVWETVPVSKSGRAVRALTEGVCHSSDNAQLFSASRVFDACSRLPQFLRHHERVDLALLPPSPLVTGCVIFAVVDGAERYRKLVAHFECNPSRLGVADMMGVRWGAATDHAWLPRNKAKMLF
jgi:hypothetical protein